MKVIRGDVSAKMTSKQTQQSEDGVMHMFEGKVL